MTAWILHLENIKANIMKKENKKVLKRSEINQLISENAIANIRKLGTVLCVE